MAEAAPNYQQHEDFWKPLATPKLQREPATRCPHCRIDLISGAKFCHACGFDQGSMPARPLSFRAQFDVAALSTALGQSIASLIALVLGSACLIAAAVTGLLFKVSTLSDWEAIQLWRIEWLLGAIALFAAGIVLKRLPARKSESR